MNTESAKGDEDTTSKEMYLPTTLLTATVALGHLLALMHLCITDVRESKAPQKERPNYLPRSGLVQTLVGASAAGHKQAQKIPESKSSFFISFHSVCTVFPNKLAYLEELMLSLRTDSVPNEMYLGFSVLDHCGEVRRPPKELNSV